jgi:hypothetical protein
MTKDAERKADVENQEEDSLMAKQGFRDKGVEVC